MNKLFKYLSIIFFTILFAIMPISFIGCKESKKEISETESQSESVEQPIYFLSDIQAAIAEGDYSSEDYKTADYPTVFFLSSFAEIHFTADLYIYNISGVQVGRIEPSVITDNYDAVKIEHDDFSRIGNCIYRSVKVTLYNYVDLIISPYEKIEYLEPQFYFICDINDLSANKV